MGDSVQLFEDRRVVTNGRLDKPRSGAIRRFCILMRSIASYMKKLVMLRVGGKNVGLRPSALSNLHPGYAC